MAVPSYIKIGLERKKNTPLCVVADIASHFLGLLAIPLDSMKARTVSNCKTISSSESAKRTKSLAKRTKSSAKRTKSSAKANADKLPALLLF